jgi:hypothetical protein
MASWKDLPGPRAIGTAITHAVDAATAGDPDAYDTATAEVAALPNPPAGIVLAAIIRTLLEEQHPDGLDSDDIQAVLARCYATTATWLPVARVDIPTLVAVLASTLGIHEPGVTYQDITAPTRATGDTWRDPDTATSIGTNPDPDAQVPYRVPAYPEYAWHAPLLLADLVSNSRHRLPHYLDAVFTDLAREQSMEHP